MLLSIEICPRKIVYGGSGLLFFLRKAMSEKACSELGEADTKKRCVSEEKPRRGWFTPWLVSGAEKGGKENLGHEGA